MAAPVRPRPAGPRDLFFFTHPEHWLTWPFLPVVRRHDDGTLDCGVLCDLRNSQGLYGYSSTVFRTNLFTLPTTLAEFLALPRQMFDRPEEMAAAGWVVD